MLEILKSHSRPRSVTIVSLLLMLQGISWLVFAVLTFVLAAITVRNAVADHKPTAATLTTAFAVVGGGCSLIIGLLVLLVAWGIWRRESWAFWGAVVLEGFAMLISLASLYVGMLWPLLAEGVLAAVLLLWLCFDRQMQGIARR